MTKNDVLQHIVERNHPVKLRALAKALSMPEAQLRPLIDELCADGALILTRKQAVGTPQMLGYLPGTLRMSASGSAFFIPHEGEEDFFVRARLDAIHCDQVLAQVVTQPHGNRLGEVDITRVLARDRQTLVGRFRRETSGACLVRPDEQRLGFDVAIPAGKERGAYDGSKVLVRLLSYPSQHTTAQGAVEQVLGMAGDPGVDIASIVADMGIPDTFAPETLHQAQHMQAAITPQEMARRTDLRDTVIFTIDGADAKDLDDAVSIEPLAQGGWRLGVHIADVAHYVRPGTPIDKEAWQRGNSVYLLNTVIPMLPEQLSNGLCSLHPGEDKLTLTCLIEFDARGRRRDASLMRSIIRSHRRLTYDQVNAALEDHDPAACEQLAAVLPQLEQLDALREVLYAQRVARGSLELDIDEARIDVDAQGVPTSISKRYRGRAHRLIEEMMLAANEAVARLLGDAHLPVLYRVHEQPDAQRMQELAIFLNNLGYRPRGLRGEVKPRALRAVLDAAHGTKHEAIVSRVLLRSLKKARYSVDNYGHFGLASTDYCHFTSPIRRYPDLMIHRQVAMLLDADTEPITVSDMYLDTCISAAAQASTCERRALEAERAVEALKMAEYMHAHIGEEFDGVISGVTDFGLFVELPNLVEGLVRMSDLHDDYYIHDKKSYALYGRSSGRRYALGDSIRILVQAVDVPARQISFGLAGRAQ